MRRVVLVTGGRDYEDRAHVIRVLDSEHEAEPIDLLVQGGARGADLFAKEWAMSRGVHYATIPALWDAHGKAAGPIRNTAMLLVQPTELIAFPGGRGTRDMVKKAVDAGLEILQVMD